MSLWGLSLRSVRLWGFDWTRGTWSDYGQSCELKFRSCVMNGSSFMGLRLEKLVLEDCRAHDVDLAGGCFSGL